jgi:hypothetical protein
MGLFTKKVYVADVEIGKALEDLPKNYLIASILSSILHQKELVPSIISAAVSGPKASINRYVNFARNETNYSRGLPELIYNYSIDNKDLVISTIEATVEDTIREIILRYKGQLSEEIWAKLYLNTLVPEFPLIQNSRKYQTKLRDFVFDYVVEEEFLYQQYREGPGYSDWSGWTVAKIKGENLDEGTHSRFVFKRSSTNPGSPTGDTHPGWTDYIPSGSSTLWLAGGTFDGNTVISWNAPMDITNTEVFQAIYSYSTSTTTIPTIPEDFSGWSLSPSTSTIYLAYRTRAYLGIVSTLVAEYSPPELNLSNYVPNPQDYEGTDIVNAEIIHTYRDDIYVGEDGYNVGDRYATVRYTFTLTIEIIKEDEYFYDGYEIYQDASGRTRLRIYVSVIYRELNWEYVPEDQREYAGETTESFVFEDLEPPNNNTYYFVAYKLTNTPDEELSYVWAVDEELIANRVGVWFYDVSSNIIPGLADYSEPIELTTVPPIAIFRERNRTINEGLEDPERLKFYNEVKKLTKIVNIPLDEILPQIEELEDLDKVSNVFFYFGVPLYTDNEACKKYIFHFFDRLAIYAEGTYEEYQRVVSGYNNLTAEYETNTSELSTGGSIQIKEAYFDFKITFNYIKKTTNIGSIGSLGTTTIEIREAITRSISFFEPEQDLSTAYDGDYFGIDTKGLSHEKVLEIFPQFEKVFAIEVDKLKFGGVGVELFYKLSSNTSFSIATCPKDKDILIIHAIEYKRSLEKRFKKK